MAQLTEENWANIANGFQKHANFPNCTGAIDSKHIRIIKLRHSGSLSVRVIFQQGYQACDTNYKFTFVDTGSYGRNSDSTIFEDSTLYERFL